MIRGTTPTHTFNLPFDTSWLKEAKIIYAQNGDVLLVKRIGDCELNGTTISLTLTQDETFLFNCEKPVEIQLRVLTIDGNALTSVTEKIGVSKCLDDEVLV